MDPSRIPKPDPKQVRVLQQAFGLHPVVATVLVNRGFDTEAAVKSFLYPAPGAMTPPFALKDMDRAVSRIHAALESGERILVFGDYDADGVTATAMLVLFFRSIGADVRYLLPHRQKEGFGLKEIHVDTAVDIGTDLIITVDCGAVDHAAVEAANRSGIDVVVTDHHSVGGFLPRAAAVVNPKREDCSANLSHLAGVGVAFYLLIALRLHLREAGFWTRAGTPEPNLKSYTDLAALGTLADMVPLAAENRVLVRLGIEILNTRCRAGMDALLKTAGVTDRPVLPEDIPFRLAPRLNAAGRMDRADTAVELLMTTDPEAAQQKAADLEAMNRHRRERERNTVDEITAHLSRSPALLDRRSLVLAGGRWHEGVLGIVASRILQRCGRTTALVAMRDGLGKASVRGAPGIDVYGVLRECGELLEDYGGHEAAGGFVIRADRLEAFRTAFETAVDRRLQSKEPPPRPPVDAEIEFASVDEALLDGLEALKPFGTGNPEPVFLSRDVRVLSQRIVSGNHRRMVLEQGIGGEKRPVAAIRFHADPAVDPPTVFETLTFQIRRNYWNGRAVLQLVILDS